MDGTPSLLQVRQLCFGWPGRPLFTGLNFDLRPGLGLVTGDDGCGKSTLLRLIAGELAPDAGSLQLPGSPLTPRDHGWREQVFWVDPQTEAHDALSAGGYLESLHRHYPNFSIEALKDLVEGFDLTPHLAKPLYMLSTGSKRKVWLSAAFAAGTAITLIDQPFAALDGPATRFLLALLQDVAGHPSRAWLIADHEAPAGVPLTETIRL